MDRNLKANADVALSEENDRLIAAIEDARNILSRAIYPRAEAEPTLAPPTKSSPRQDSEAHGPNSGFDSRDGGQSWVIERGDSCAAEPKYWAAGQRDAERSSAWTSNHMQAIRFARRLDAERVAARIMKGVEVRICEHAWTETPSPTSAESTGGQG